MSIFFKVRRGSQSTMTDVKRKRLDVDNDGVQCPHGCMVSSSRPLEVTLTPDARLPVEPWQFRGMFIWVEIENDTGMPTNQASHNDMMGKIALDVIEEDGDDFITLVGTMDPLTHSSNRISVTGHNNAVAFQVISTNFNPMISKKVLWKRTFSPGELRLDDGKDFLDAYGYAPDVPNGRTTGTASITFGPGNRRGTKTVSQVRIKLTRVAYNAWVNQYMF